MPTYEVTCLPEEMPDKNRCKSWKALVVLVFLFYVFSCGIERIFQSTVRFLL